MNINLQNRDNIIDNSKELNYSIIPNKKEDKIETQIIYWVNAPKIDSTLWINT